MTTMSAGQALASKALGAYPSYGLSMRFLVTVTSLKNVTDLGLWQSCKGLQVDLQYKKFEQGGQYTQQCWCPDKLAYGKITLERAVDRKDSQVLQDWLKGYIDNWQSYPSIADAAPLATDVVINLLDFQLNPVMSWTLYQARPSRWLGPTLSANENKVAIETLEFEHEGFLYKD